VQLEEQRRAEEAAAAAAAEAAREAALQEAYEASLPDDIKERVVVALEREVVRSMHSLINTAGQCLNNGCHPTLNSSEP
jgi:phage protein D